jgi:hypothetical protein
MVKKIIILFCTLMTISISCPTSAAPSTYNQQFFNAVEKAYIYAYPLVLMGTTKNVMTNVIEPDSSGNARAPINQFVHMKQFPSSTTGKDVVRPNQDTLYSIAWLDLTKQPMILILPDSHNRYYLMQMLDAWTNVFASPGKRTTGTKAQCIAIVGPNWQGSLPADVTKIQAPTNLVWIIGRTETKGVSDYDNVHQFQDGIKLIPLDQINNHAYTPPLGTVNANINMLATPPRQVAAMNAVTFFKTFAQLLKTNPPHQSDIKIIAELKKIGIVPGKGFNSAKLTSDKIDILNHGIKSAYEKIKLATESNNETVDGWSIRRNDIGNYGNNYLVRSVIALRGLGANIPQDAIYPSTFVDISGKQLNGKHNYVLHFDKNKLPPVNAFWSVTLYNPQGYFVANNLERYAIGDRDKLKFNNDGSLDIYIQHNSPGIDKESNWLPAPSGDFNLLMRLYWPKESVIAGQWVPPGIQRIS